MKREKTDEVKNCEIAYINLKDFKKLWNLREEVKNEMIKNGIDEKEALKYALYDKIKIINPSPEKIRVAYYGEMSRLSVVKDKEKIIEKYLNKDFEIWKNVKIKNLENYIKRLHLSKEDAKIKRELAFREIEMKEKIKNEIKKNPENFDIIRTNILTRMKTTRTLIFFYTQKGEYLKVPLREKVVNVVCESEEPFFVKIRNRKEKIINEIKEMTNLFDNLFIRKKL